MCGRSRVREGASGKGRDGQGDSQQRGHGEAVAQDVALARGHGEAVALDAAQARGRAAALVLDHVVAEVLELGQADVCHCALAPHSRLRGMCHSPVHAFLAVCVAEASLEPSRAAEPEERWRP